MQKERKSVLHASFLDNPRKGKISRDARARWALKNISDAGSELSTIPSSGHILDPATNYISNDETEIRPSPSQINTGDITEVGTPATNPASAVDILATGAFDHKPAAEIGYFGEVLILCKCGRLGLTGVKVQLPTMLFSDP